MKKTLTDKQQKLLASFSQQQLLEIINSLIESDKNIKEKLIQNWLTPLEQQVKNLEKAYNKIYKRVDNSKNYFDYYKSDAIFDEIIDTITEPMITLAPQQPQAVNHLAQNMLQEFDELTERLDTSSGHWSVVYLQIYQAFFASLVHTNDNCSEIAEKLYDQLIQDQYFDFDILKDYKQLFPRDILVALQMHCIEEKDLKNALILSVMIKDIATSKTLLKQNATAQNEILFELVQILLDELDTESAIEILESIKTKVTNDSRFNSKWVKLMAQAYIDQCESGQARTLILSAFKAEQLPKYWLLYLKAGGNSQNDLPLFMEILSKKELEIQITFLFALENFSEINQLIIDNSSDISETIRYNLFSFYRKLSTQLAKQGLFHSAILLRQSLSEATVSLKKSTYYQHAVSDIKKAIDYTLDSQSSEMLTLMNNWLTEFHQQHAKKPALWSLFYQTIDPALIKFG